MSKNEKKSSRKKTTRQELDALERKCSHLSGWLLATIMFSIMAIAFMGIVSTHIVRTYKERSIFNVLPDSVGVKSDSTLTYKD